MAWLEIERERGAEEKVKDALSVLSADYASDVTSVAEELIDRVKRREITDRDGFLEAMHETIDGHHNVIYTHAAQIVVLCSSNDGASIENFGTDGVVKDGAINWSSLAFGAMEADVYAELERLDFNVNDDDSYGDDDEEDEDDE